MISTKTEYFSGSHDYDLGFITRQMDRFQFMEIKLLADMSYINIFQDPLKKNASFFFQKTV